MDGVTTTHSGRVTPAAAASSDESTDNCELGAEAPGEEMDTTTATTAAATEDAVVGGPDADAATDNLATRYANLDSPADRYVCFPFSPLFTICVMTGQLAYCSLFHLSCLCLGISRATCHCHCHFFLLVHRNRLLGGDVFILLPTLYVLPPIHVLSRFLGGWLDRTKAGFHSQLDRLPLPHDLHLRRLADDRGTCRVHQRRPAPGQARGIRHCGGHACCQDVARPRKRRL
jgi:hypothetical protein